MKKLILVLFVYLLNGVYSQQQCTTPDQIRGSCVPLNSCTRLYNIIAATPLSNANRVFLQQSQCGYAGGQVLVCCAPVATPSGGGGNGANLLPQPGVCGSGTEDRILGGTATDIDEFPWMVLLEFSKPNNQRGFHCGGVLINNRYVVTASHCVNGRAIPSTWNLSSVRLGEYDTKSERDCVETDCADPVVNVRIAEKIPHESYDPASKNQANDIALLRLERTVQFTDFIKPICLPRTQSLRNTDLTGIALSVSGWGKTENVSASNLKLKVTVNGVANAECNRIYSSQRITLQSSQFCAGGEKGRDSCQGDSGGPIMAIDTSTRTAYWYLAGVVSFGPSPCGLEGWPGVYTRMGNYVDWIESKIRA